MAPWLQDPWPTQKWDPETDLSKLVDKSNTPNELHTRARVLEIGHVKL